MHTDSGESTSVAVPPKKPSRTTKLLQAAALAAVLVPLGTVAVQTSTIQCGTTSGGGGQCTASGYYSPSPGSGSNTWEFYQNSNYTGLLYSFQVSGTPTRAFNLDVSDWVMPYGLTGGVNFPTLTCVPTYGAFIYGSYCGLFDVTVYDQTPTAGPLFYGDYNLKITWFTNGNAASDPAPPYRVTILQAKDLLADGSPNTSYQFTNQLRGIWYNPNLPPPDPAIGGRGDSFSRFGVFTDSSLDSGRSAPRCRP